MLREVKEQPQSPSPTHPRGPAQRPSHQQQWRWDPPRRGGSCLWWEREQRTWVRRETPRTSTALLLHSSSSSKAHPCEQKAACLRPNTRQWLTSAVLVTGRESLNFARRILCRRCAAGGSRRGSGRAGPSAGVGMHTKWQRMVLVQHNDR